MTTLRFDAVGFCAHYSPAGDWAFAHALKLAVDHGRQLNVFHFLADPYQRDAPAARLYSPAELSKLVLERERELRLYYDERAGDYVEVGFRLCYDDSWRELHRCLAGHEFQVLVLARPEEGAWFCRKPIEEFARAFVCPVVLVGPEGPQQLTLNSTAALHADRLGLGELAWERIETGRARSA